MSDAEISQGMRYDASKYIMSKIQRIQISRRTRGWNLDALMSTVNKHSEEHTEICAGISFHYRTERIHKVQYRNSMLML
jgi:hypothetical protein